MSRPSAIDAASVAGSGAPSGFGVTSTSSPALMNIDPDLRKCLAEVNTMLAIHVAAWMKKRGKSLRPKLSDEQRKQLEECFELMDADGSGAIDADELGAAFKLLGLDVSKSEIGAMLAEVDEDGSGEVEYPEFIEIMTSTLSKLAHKKEEEGSGASQVPFALLATAYRRKRIMEGLISGDREVMAQVTSIAEHAARRAADEAQQQQKLMQQAGRQRGSSQMSSQPSYLSSPTAAAGSSGSSIFRSPQGSNNGSASNSLDGASNPEALAAAQAATAAAAAGEARATQVAAQAHIPTGLMRALQHVRSFCTSHSSSTSSRSLSTISSPTGSQIAASSSIFSSAGGAVAAAGAAGTKPLSAAGGGGGSGAGASGRGAGGEQGEDLGWLLPVEAVSGVLDMEEQRQLIGLLRAKTRKRLEAIAAAAAAAGTPGAASLSPSCWPSASGAASRSAAGGASGSSGTGTAAGITGISTTTADGGSGCAGVGAGAGCEAVGGSSRSPAGELEGLVGARQRMTSTLMLRQLTQDVQQPKFALSGPAERSPAASRASGSPSPTRSCSSRGCKSSSPSPFPIRQHSAASLASAAAAAIARDSSNVTPNGLSPSAASAVADGNPDGDSRSGEGIGGKVALRKGINFGDTQIYEYQCRAPGSGDNNSNSRSGSRTRGSSSRRSSNRSSDGGNLGEGMTRSRSLGSLLSVEKGLLVSASSAASAATAAAVGLRREPSGSGGRACKSPGASLSGAASSKNLGVVSSISSSGDGSKSSDRTKKSPSRGPSSSNLRMPSATAAALQQVGLGCGLQAVGGAAGVGAAARSCMTAPGQLQQQWLAVPQLPRMGGGVHASGAQHKRCKSSSPVLCAAEQQPGGALLLAPQAVTAAAVGGKPR